MVFLIAMVSHPEIQKRAQKDIEHVTRGQRLPIMVTRSRYHTFKPLFERYFAGNQSLPLGITHVNDKDDVYNGYHIPKGELIRACETIISDAEAQISA